MKSDRIKDATTVNYTLALKYLRHGKLVCFPTETVYGLGADATNSKAIAGIFSAKKRPLFNPLIIHFNAMDQIEKYVELDPLARRLGEKFWPGPFTMVLPQKPHSGLSDLVTAGLETVAVRIPAHPVAQKFLELFEGPLAAPSANISGQVSPTRPEHVDDAFGPELPLIFDGGPCTAGVESTIIQITEPEILILRPGSITPEDIEKEADRPIRIVQEGAAINAPGQMKSHYAPRAQLRLNATSVCPDEGLLAFGNQNPKGSFFLRNLSPSGSLTEAAANLFAMLREMDNMNMEVIAVSPIPYQGLGLAINDRLARAAAPRENTP